MTVQIKPLEWRPTNGGEGGFIGKQQYRFVRYGYGGPEYGLDVYPTIEDAKKQAQTEHEAFILNAVERT